MQRCTCGHLLRSHEEQERQVCLECRIHAAMRSRSASFGSRELSMHPPTTSYQHAIATDASRQAARDCAWIEGEDEEETPFMLNRKQLKRDAWHKAAAYARAARQRYAISYERAYKQRHRARHMRSAS